MTIHAVNGLDREGFVAAFGAVCENSPWVAARTFTLRPFVSRDDLEAKMRRVVESASEEEQLALIREHPDLGTRAKVSASSATEQADVGLHQLTQHEFDVIASLNKAYRARFGFPFIYAVKGSDKHAIIQALAARSENDPKAEFTEALQQIHRIARLRIEGLVD
jgi:2-oxo-4-hydroxy-4-carboxy-5-ureidoimidazoline decarboxylase